MWNIKNQIWDASKLLNIEITEISEFQKEKLFTDIKNKYLINQMEFPIWERLNDAQSKCDEHAWQWVKDFIGDTTVILFFNTNDEKNTFILKSGKDVVSIIGEIFNVEFYLTNEKTSYLICFNHHDVLLASGEAKKWLEEYNKLI